MMGESLVGGSATRQVESEAGGEAAGWAGDPGDHLGDFIDAQEARHRNLFAVQKS
jgi:hypothetical protein